MTTSPRTGEQIDERDHSFEAEIASAARFDSRFRVVADRNIDLDSDELRDSFSDAWHLIRDEDGTFVVPSSEAWAEYARSKFADETYGDADRERQDRAGRAMAASKLAEMDGSPLFYRDQPNGCAMLFDRDGIVEMRDERVGRGVAMALEANADADGLPIGVITEHMALASQEDPVSAKWGEYRQAAARKALLAALASRVQDARPDMDDGQLHQELEGLLVEWGLAQEGEVPQLTLGYAFDAENGAFIGVTGKLTPNGHDPLAAYPEYVAGATADGRAPEAGPTDPDWAAGLQDERFAQIALHYYLHPEATIDPLLEEARLHSRIDSNNNVF